PIDAVTAQRHMALLRASWDLLEEVVAVSPAQLRKGPRGGGRDRDEIRRHVIEAERAYARKIGVRHKPFEMNDKTARKAMRDDKASVLASDFWQDHRATGFTRLVWKETRCGAG